MNKLFGSVEAFASNLMGEWFGRFEDIVEYIKEEGYDVIDIIGGEWICFFDVDERIEYVVETEKVDRSTYIIKKVREA